MSIATNSVLRRILEDVIADAVPAPEDAVTRAQRTGQLFELRRTRCLYSPPHSTPLHFWARALRSFLREHERLDAFDALSRGCLCETVSGADVERALRDLAVRFAMPVAALPDLARHRGYRMIDQPVLSSWLGEGRDEFIAVFWADAGWLAEATPLADEPLGGVGTGV